MNRSLPDRRNSKAARKIGFRERSALHLISRSIIGDPTSRAFSPPHDRALGAFRRTHPRPATDATGCNAQREKPLSDRCTAAGKSCRWSYAPRGLIILSIGQAVMHVEQLTKHLRISPMQNAIRRFTYTQHFACILMTGAT